MRTKDLLLGFLASAFLVGCSQNEDAPGGGEDKNGAKDSYVTVKIKSSTNNSRAVTSDGFEYGTTDENEVKSAHFFFFKSDGTTFKISAPDETNYGGTAVGNWLYFASFNANGTENSDTPAGNIEEVIQATLVFKGDEGDEIPASIVAVLNMDNDELSSYTSGITLTELQKIMIENAYNTSDTKKYFVMSNSVYAKNNAKIQSQELTTANVAANTKAAEQNSVTIHVERLAVRVEVGATYTEKVPSSEASENAFDTATDITLDGASTATGVYAKIISWDINTTINQSYLLKDIDPAWADATLGFAWNDSPNYRSYWAASPTGTYTTAFDFAKFNALGAKDYCLENTGNTKTKVIVRAQLVDNNGQALEIAQWYATYYKFTDLKGAVASSLKEQLYYSTDEGKNWKSIAAKGENEAAPAGLDYIALIAGDGNEVDEASDYYKVSFDLSEAGKDVKWASDEKGTTSLTSDQVSTKLKALLSAKVWTDGATYYYTDIEHLGTDAIRNFGVVRNHVYKINIEGVKGLGTPVYATTGDDGKPVFPEIPEPVTPEGSESYIAAKINILSWKIVNNSVILGQ